MVMSSPIWSDSPCKYQHIDVRVDGDWRRPLRSWGMSKWRETPAKRTRSAHPWDGKFMLKRTFLRDKKTPPKRSLCRILSL